MIGGFYPPGFVGFGFGFLIVEFVVLVSCAGVDGARALVYALTRDRATW
jgi:hypothetical protein